MRHNRLRALLNAGEPVVEELDAVLSIKGIDMVDEPRPDRQTQSSGRGEGGAA